MVLDLDHTLFFHRAIYYGLYEESLVNFLKTRLRPGNIVLEPGANIGYISAVCVGLVGSTGHVHSFEPSPTANARIERITTWPSMGIGHFGMPRSPITMGRRYSMILRAFWKQAMPRWPGGHAQGQHTASGGRGFRGPLLYTEQHRPCPFPETGH